MACHGAVFFFLSLFFFFQTDMLSVLKSVCVRLILYFQQVSVLKLSGGPLNGCSDNSEGLPLIFHLSLLLSAVLFRA